MTAKELAEECHTYYFGYPETKEDKGIYHFTFDEFQAFCEHLCREQREKCADSYIDCRKDTSFDELNDLILNAPMPEV